jgi:hypothetical protein
LPAQLGVHSWAHVPALQLSPLGHAPALLPHVPPHPSLPQSRPAQLGVQPHCPEPSQAKPLPQLPQLPPQPSSPHALPMQSGWHEHLPSDPQLSVSPQLPQPPPQLSEPHCLPLQSAVHCPTSQVPVRKRQVRAPLHVFGQVPPQPSSPHCLPAQLGTHAH